MTAAAIKATWSSYKHLPTRNCLQLVLEVPLEQQADVFEKLGYPVPGTEKWVGVALLNISATDKPGQSKEAAPAERPRRRFDELPRSQQAALMCNRPDFQTWAGMASTDSAAQFVRDRCRVDSRAKLDTDAAAAQRWDTTLLAFQTDMNLMAEIRG